MYRCANPVAQDDIHDRIADIERVTHFGNGRASSEGCSGLVQRREIGLRAHPIHMHLLDRCIQGLAFGHKPEALAGE